MLLPIFNIIRCFPPEYIHSVLLGVVKLFLSYWIVPKNHEEASYFGTKTRLIDERLLEFLPPREISRTPQSVTNLSQWKASEYRNFLLYYSMPTLKNILPDIYYKHWSLLVYAITIFNGDKINMQEYEKAKRAINKFVQDIEPLYGKELMKFNVHLLLHIPKSVEDFGALWAWSAFIYETNNYVLRNMLHSSQTILQQICKTYLRFQSIKFNEIFSRPDCSTEGKTLYLKMMKNYRTRTGTKIAADNNDNNLIIFGDGKMIEFSLV